MRKISLTIVVLYCIALAVSCSAGKGCPSNGRNVGAERLLNGDKKAMKLAKRAGKFRH
jgi:hypothetical protein